MAAKRSLILRCRFFLEKPQCRIVHPPLENVNWVLTVEKQINLILLMNMELVTSRGRLCRPSEPDLVLHICVPLFFLRNTAKQISVHLFSRETRPSLSAHSRCLEKFPSCVSIAPPATLVLPILMLLCCSFCCSSCCTSAGDPAAPAATLLRRYS